MADAGNWIVTTNARQRYAKGDFNLDSGSFACALFLSNSNIGPASTTYALLTNEHANSNGYQTGGIAVEFAFTGTTTVAIAFTGGNPTWVATGGMIVAHYGVLYEITGDVFAYCLLDSNDVDVTAAEGYQMVIDSDGTPNPAFTLSGAAS